MTREEWYKNWSASRILIKSVYASFPCGWHGQSKENAKNPAILACEMAQHAIKLKIGKKMLDNLWYSKYITSEIYNIKTEKWAVKHNSRAFNRIQHIRDRG
tara:strand:+ start:1138 stop:1440 length:303 start_codon:yes stop_codon:yes gene_type:complete